MISFSSILVEEDSYQKLINLLNLETKLNFQYYQRKFIERRIKSRMIRVDCSTIDSYYDYILSNPFEVNRFQESFNINYSYFFRNWDVFERFQKLFIESMNYKGRIVLSDLQPNPSNKFNLTKKKSRKKKRNYPEIPDFSLRNFNLTETSLYRKIRRRSANPIHIWSCPCAYGEEPYSIAMILDNLQIQIPNFPYFKIVASDIDKNVVHNARLGVYNEYSIKDISEYFEKNYFMKRKQRGGFKFVIKNHIKNSIEFINEDVTNGHQKSWKYDIVFCRNLLIYLNRDNRDKFLSIIETRMNRGGLLILGKTETLFNRTRNFKLVDSKNHIYMKIN